MNNLFFYEFYIIVLEPYLIFLISGFLQYEMLKGFTPPSDSIDESSKRQLATETSSSSKTSYAQAKFKHSLTKDGLYATIMLIICLVITPIQFLYYLKHSINMHQRLKFINRSGSLFEDVELRSKWSAAFLPRFYLSTNHLRLFDLQSGQQLQFTIALFKLDEPHHSHLCWN